MRSLLSAKSISCSTAHREYSSHDTIANDRGGHRPTNRCTNKDKCQFINNSHLALITLHTHTHTIISRVSDRSTLLDLIAFYLWSFIWQFHLQNRYLSRDMSHSHYCIQCYSSFRWEIKTDLEYSQQIVECHSNS